MPLPSIQVPFLTVHVNVTCLLFGNKLALVLLDVLSAIIGCASLHVHKPVPPEGISACKSRVLAQSALPTLLMWETTELFVTVYGKDAVGQPTAPFHDVTVHTNVLESAFKAVTKVVAVLFVAIVAPLEGLLHKPVWSPLNELPTKVTVPPQYSVVELVTVGVTGVIFVTFTVEAFVQPTNPTVQVNVTVLCGKFDTVAL